VTGNVPALSVVLPTDSWATIRRVVEHLSRQTIADRLELIFATPDPDRLCREAASALRGFNRTEAVGESLERLSTARYTAIGRTTAPYVFLGETHTFPHPGWAEAILRGHEKWDVVVPSFGNANPGRSLSWAAFISDYGSWSPGLRAGEVVRWPAVNASYPRVLLEKLAGQAETVFERAGGMAELARQYNLRAGFVPDARIDHANVATPRAWARERYLVGIVLAGPRSAEWPLARRAVYAAGSPLLIPLLIKRTFPALRRGRRHARLPVAVAAAWVAGIAIRACGEAVGFIRGVRPGDVQRMNEYEIHKLRYAEG
jgi:hypothetical protein